MTAGLKGVVRVPGDKSISHRAIMLGALAEGTTEITHFLQGMDCLATIRCFRQLGIAIDNNPAKDRVIIYGKGLYGLKSSGGALDVGNSGTTMRLMSGILCGQNFPSVMTGDDSIRRRPMDRIVTPLRLMDADIISKDDNGCAPLLINHSDKGRFKLQGISYASPVASAQVKSCILLAGLFADDVTSITEPVLSRNHTELMLAAFGAKVKSSKNTVIVMPEQKLTGRFVNIPGDISSAAYFIAAGLIVPNSEIVIKNVGINSTRSGILTVCKKMGAEIRLENVTDESGEPAADIIVKSSRLHGTEIGGDIIPSLIDEIPILAVLACFAEGRTVIKDAAELKVKESNRIDVMVNNLAKMGADIEAAKDGMVISGGKALHGAVIESKQDHRIAMSFAVASLMADGTTQILNPECVEISYPGFYSDMQRLSQ